MMTFLATIAIVLIIGAAGLMLAMFRRDEPILGLASLAVAVTAGLTSMLYAGLDGA
jgi:hypothetical protein